MLDDIPQSAFHPGGLHYQPPSSRISGSGVEYGGSAYLDASHTGHDSGSTGFCH